MGKSERKETTQRLYEDVRKEYQKLNSKKHNGTIIYSQDYILNLLANKFYKSAKTIENIVFNRV